MRNELKDFFYLFMLHRFLSHVFIIRNASQLLISTHRRCHKVVPQALWKDRRGKFHCPARYAVVHDRLERALAQKRRRCIFEIFRSGLKGQENRDVRDENRYFLT